MGSEAPLNFFGGDTMDSISKMIANVEEEARDAIDLPEAIAMLVRQAVAQEVDPYVTLGVLVESIAHTLARTIPEPKKIETATDITRLLLHRFAAQGVIG